MNCPSCNKPFQNDELRRSGASLENGETPPLCVDCAQVGRGVTEVTLYGPSGSMVVQIGGTMLTDSFYKIGSSHKVCQDYAGHGEGWAAISDGCSSSPDSDWGSRLLIRAQALLPQCSPEDIGAIAGRMRDCLGLPEECLDATFGRIEFKNDAIHMKLVGDGVIASQFQGELHYSSTSFDGNMPFYLNYLQNDRRRKAFYDSVQFIRRTVGARVANTMDWLQSDRVTEGLPTTDVRTFEAYSNTPGRLLLVFSDGVESFMAADGRQVPLTVVLDEFMQFKNFTGQFIARRCQAFFKRCERLGWTHFDDFSVAGAYLP